MTAPQPFCLGITPRDGESLPGIMIRLAGRLRMRSACSLATKVGLRQPGSAATTDSMNTLASRMGLDVRTLDRASYRPSGASRQCHFHQGTLHRDLIDLSRRRVCPACLETAPYHQSTWDLALITTCPIHAVRLVERCPYCGREFDWRRPSIDRCRCGANLAAIQPVAATPAEAEASARVLALALGRPVSWLSPDLGACDASDLLRLAMCIGMFLTGWTEQRRVGTLMASGPDQVAMVMIAGMRALGDWPESIASFLRNEMAKAGGREGRFGAKKALGAFYAWLIELDVGRPRQAVIDVVQALVAEDGLLARRIHRSHTLTAGWRSATQAMALTDVAWALGVSEPTVKRMASTGMLPSPDGQGRGGPMAFDRTAVRALAQHLPELLNLSQTAHMLAIPKTKVRRLADSGILRPLHRANSDGWAKWAFEQGGVEELLRKLERCLEPIGSDRALGWNQAVHMLSLRGIAIEDFVRAVLDRRVAVANVDRDASGLQRLQFDRLVLQRLVEGAYDNEALPVSEVARRLSVKRQVVAHLIQIGLLTARGRRVPSAALAKFKAEYVTGAQLARQTNMSARTLERKLAAFGVIPTTGPNTDGSRQNFYRRDGIPIEVYACGYLPVQ